MMIFKHHLICIITHINITVVPVLYVYKAISSTVKLLPSVGSNRYSAKAKLHANFHINFHNI